MKANTATISMIIAMVAMIGMTGTVCAVTPVTYDSSVTLENKDSNWHIIPDGISATVDYNLAGDEFEYHAYGNAVGNMQYSLIYYADQPNRFVNWGGDNPGALIGTISTTPSGSFDTGSMSVDLGMDLPCVPDANMNISEHDYCGAPDYYAHCTGAKLWMVPTAALPNPYPGNGAWVFWNTGGILFETDLITYTDTTDQISIGDVISCEGIVTPITIPIVVSRSENVGAVDLTLTYNASLVNVTGVTDGDMDVTVPVYSSGQVNIGTYQKDNPGLSGEFILANVTFVPAAAGTCDFVITVTTFEDDTFATATMPYVTREGVYSTISYTPGDVNNNSAVTMGDVMVLAKHLVGVTGFETIDECAADVDFNDVVDTSDVMYLAKHLLGMSGFESLVIPAYPS